MVYYADTFSYILETSKKHSVWLIFPLLNSTSFSQNDPFRAPPEDDVSAPLPHDHLGKFSIASYCMFNFSLDSNYSWHRSQRYESAAAKSKIARPSHNHPTFVVQRNFYTCSFISTCLG